MANDLNQVHLIGRCGKDPEVRYMTNGNAVCNVSLATGESWKDKNTGEKVEKTEWHRVVFYGPLAEIVGEYVTKGKQIYIGGKLTTRKWQDKEGKDVYTTEIVCDQMQLLGGGEGGGQGGGRQQSGGGRGQGGGQAEQQRGNGGGRGDGYGDQQARGNNQARGSGQARNQQRGGGNGGGKTGTGFDDMDDDIPFISMDASHDMVSKQDRRMRKYRFSK